MTVGQSENIEVKVLTFILATLLTLLFLPIIALGLIGHVLLNIAIPIINAVNHLKIFLVNKYISFTNMPLDGKRK